jgi:murein DD-endopeptidase MepM/ murein hydrolase activator NlpD
MFSKGISLALVSAIFFCESCNSSINKFFNTKTPHESYARQVEKSAGGQRWLAVSKAALLSPAGIDLPYRHKGLFPAATPRALALKFTAKKGQRIRFEIGRETKDSFLLFADLYRQEKADLNHLLAADTGMSDFLFDVAESGTYVLRLQPELFREADYSIALSIAPSLGFPVAGTKARIGSYWGDARDAGKRKHEGIDIFAPKLTPVIASADGHVTKVGNGGIGGKVVWLNVAERDVYLYYAHLDQQWVEPGQRVSKGDTLGLVGNTGNARFTPAHLHFGVYGMDGPVDPLPFVNKEIRSAPDFKARELTGYLKFRPKSNTKKGGPLTDELLVPLAVTSNSYLAELPDGTVIQTPFSSVRRLTGNELQKELAKKKPAISTAPSPPGI